MEYKSRLPRNEDTLPLHQLERRGGSAGVPERGRPAESGPGQAGLLVLQYYQLAVPPRLMLLLLTAKPRGTATRRLKN